jgi:tetratricopeptide (TPR) repeat protein
MARSLGQNDWCIGALAALIALASAMPQAVAVEEMRQFNKDDGKKAGNTKSCPSGQRYSEKKRGCIRTSCGTGQVWSSGVDACLDGNSAALTDEDLYLAAGDLVLEARSADALPLLFRIKNRNNPQVLNLIGYSTRKLGDVDKGIDYYHQALAIDPNYTKARQYLGEAYLLKDDVAKAKEQLMEIADRCGGPCGDYELLVKAIVAHVTGEKNTDWQF